MKLRIILLLSLLLLLVPSLAQAEDFDWMRFAGSEITILMPEHPVLDGMRSVMDDFEAATGISVNVEALAENLYFDRMEVALRADTGVMDVYMVPMDSTAFTQWSNGLIHPLSPYITDASMSSADYDFADFPAGFTQATQYPPGAMDAQDYAIPVSFEAYTLFWNMDIVDEYLDGVVPDTMAGLIDAAHSISEASGGMVAGSVMRGIRSHTIMDTVTGMVFNNWGEAEMTLPTNVWYDGDWSMPQVDDERITAGLSHYAGLMSAGPINVQALDWPDASLLFQQGRAGFFIDASLFGPGFEDPEASAVAGKTGYAVMPPVEAGGDSWTGHWMWGIGIPANSQNPDAAWYFIQWMTSADIEPVIGAYHGGAARVSTWDKAEYVDALNPLYVDTVLEAMQTSRTTVVFREGWSEYALVIVDAIQDMYGGMAPADATAKAQQRLLDMEE
ncbi:MAG: extracellular solute-binding protein [Chloroflexi bacterium]|nr:extracellular solute-binding protein [Chloroflexota bacterium]MCY4247242.1 extracellular solute-binding protein [Chloroflexota bacterium]